LTAKAVVTLPADAQLLCVPKTRRAPVSAVRCAVLAGRVVAVIGQGRVSWGDGGAGG